MKTQTERVLDYLMSHPGASSLEMTTVLAIVNITGRISDLRAQGHTIIDVREGGVHRYYLVHPDEQLRLGVA